MNRPTFLLDTNIFIPLEDNREVQVEYQMLQSLAAQHGLRLCVHEAIIRDIQRDKNEARRAISLSKVGKFALLGGVHLPAKPVLEAAYGSIADDNELVDVENLHALAIGAVDFLITQDEGIHDRAKRAGISGQVLRVEEALSWIDASFVHSAVELPFVRDVLAHQLNFDDPIFESVKAEYADFDAWVRKCRREQRAAWIVERRMDYAAVVILKEEGPPPDADIDLDVPKLLKLCLFKVSERHAGLRLGELLLKKSLRFATKNGFGGVYLTAYPKHHALVELCGSAGFFVAGQKKLELIIAKRLVGSAPANATLLELQRFHFPRFLSDARVQKIVVPINARYHQRLFPEASGRRERDLLDILHQEANDDAVPGNTFRKVYVTRSRMNKIQPGDLLLFYVNKNTVLIASQAITYLGVVESVQEASGIDELLRMTAKRTAYLRSDLQKLFERPGTIRVIEFMAIGPMKPPLGFEDLKRLGILSGPPQSLMSIDDEAFAKLGRHSGVVF
jgi:rRNA-processing protein FCF1